MAGPLYGLGAQAQVPLTSPNQQQAQAAQARNDQQKQAVTNEVQPQGAEAAESQNAQTSSNNLFDLSQEELSAVASQGRGALLDVLV